MQRGLEILCEVFLAAGAQRVLPLVPAHDEVNSALDLGVAQGDAPGTERFTSLLHTIHLARAELGPTLELASGPTTRFAMRRESSYVMAARSRRHWVQIHK